MKKIHVFFILLSIFVLTGVFAFTHTSIPKDTLFLENVAALADDPAVGWFTGEEDCCKNGYKIWGTEGLPWQTEKQFKDCWCRDQKGYSPEACSC